MKRLFLSMLTVFLITALAPVAYAQEIIPEVSTLEELQAAIAQAEAGDTIKIMQTMDISESTDIGVVDKPVSLMVYGTVDTAFSIEGGRTDTVWFNDLTIDGMFGGVGNSKVRVNSEGAVYFQNVYFDTCQTTAFGGAVYIERGSVYMFNGGFRNCTSDLGGAVYVNVNGAFYPTEVTFSGNSTKREGGAIYSCGTLQINQCNFKYNSAVEKGGAVCGLNVDLQGGQVMNNQAERGGGLFLFGTSTIKDCRIYENTSELSGADILSDGAVSIIAQDYEGLFSEEIASGNYDSYAWFDDTEGNRYSEDNITSIFSDTRYLSSPAMKFVLYNSEPEPEPTPEPEPEPEPESPTVIEKVIIVERVVEKEPEVPEQTVMVESLSYGKAVLEGKLAADLLPVLERFVPSQQTITRGELASIVYGLMSEDAQEACIRASESRYDDMGNSPYRTAVDALSAAEVLSGRSDNLFAPDDVLTYGQLLSVMGHFANPPKTFVPFVTESSHWASSAVQTAVAVGWFPDLPIDLDAPATYGSLCYLLTAMFKL